MFINCKQVVDLGSVKSCSSSSGFSFSVFENLKSVIISINIINKKIKIKKILLFFFFNYL